MVDLVLRFVWRLLLVAVGLLVAASLVVAVLIALAVWGVRYLWARLTGRPVQAWVMHFDPRAGFRRFTDPTGADLPRQGPSWTRDRAWNQAEGVADVEVKEPPTR